MSENLNPIKIILDVPADIIIIYLLPLLKTSTLLALGQVNKKLAAICEDERIWKIKSQIEFPSILSPSLGSWKLTYKQFYLNPPVPIYCNGEFVSNVYIMNENIVISEIIKYFEPGPMWIVFIDEINTKAKGAPLFVNSKRKNPIEFQYKLFRNIKYIVVVRGLDLNQYSNVLELLVSNDTKLPIYGYTQKVIKNVYNKEEVQRLESYIKNAVKDPRSQFYGMKIRAVRKSLEFMISPIGTETLYKDIIIDYRNADIINDRYAFKELKEILNFITKQNIESVSRKVLIQMIKTQLKQIKHWF